MEKSITKFSFRDEKNEKGTFLEYITQDDDQIQYNEYFTSKKLNMIYDTIITIPKKNLDPFNFEVFVEYIKNCKEDRLSNFLKFLKDNNIQFEEENWDKPFDE